jgi:hypothetical protein
MDKTCYVSNQESLVRIGNEMTTDSEKKEALRKKSLGELGELFGIKALVDSSFEKVVNLNDKKMNNPFADLYAEKDNRKFIISIKARNKYQRDHALNAHYKLGGIAYEQARVAEKEYEAEAHWMAIQFDAQTYSVYFGSLVELKQRNAIPIRECEQGKIGACLVKDKRHYFDFSFFENKKNANVT